MAHTTIIMKRNFFGLLLYSFNTGPIPTLSLLHVPLAGIYYVPPTIHVPIPTLSLLHVPLAGIYYMPPTIHVPIPTLSLLHVPLADDMCGVSTEVAGVWNTSDFDHVLHHVTFAVSVVGEGQGTGGGGVIYAQD